MFARVAYTMAAAAGLVVGGIAVVTDPARAVVWVAAGVFVGAIATWLRGRGTRDAAVAGTSRTGLRAGAATCAGGLVLTGLGTLLGPASGIVILTLLAGALGLALAATAVGAPDRSGRTGQPGAPRVVPAAEPPSR